MSDKITERNQLILLAGFADEDDRTISVPDPKAGLTKAQIDAVGELAIGVLIGDKYGAAFTRWKSAKYRNTTVTNYDLEE